MTYRVLVAVPLIWLLASCSAASDSDGSFGNGGTGGSSGASGASGSGGTAGSVTGGSAGSAGSAGIAGSAGSSGSAGGGPPTCQPNAVEAEVFAHSSNTLYRIDPNTLQLTTVGNLNCDGSVIDIALDENGQMYGTTFTSLLKIDKSNASCSTLSSGSFPNSLSFVPAGTIHPDKEALVGYNGAQYFEIDTTTGAMIGHGALGVVGLESSGDIVSVIGGGTYLTVKGNSCGDCLVKVDPSNGSILENYGDIGYGSVFGLAFWGGVVYGFTDAGEVFSYDIVSHTTASVQVNGASSYYGAGSSTCVPPDKIQ